MRRSSMLMGSYVGATVLGCLLVLLSLPGANMLYAAIAS